MATVHRRILTRRILTRRLGQMPCMAALMLLLCIPALAPAAAAKSGPLPFDPLPASRLRASPKKVFAHYFTPFPISLDNSPPDQDYYTTQYLDPAGESGKHRAYGGFLRDRPLPRPPRPQSDWAHRDMCEEVRRAAAIGLDGFACDILATSGTHWDRVQDLMAAASETDPGFKILLEPDMTAEFGAHPERLVGAIETLARSPAAYRLADGRLVVAPYNAQGQTPAWWRQALASLHAAGVEVALLPIFQGWDRYAAAYAPFSFGYSDWGRRDPIDAEALRQVPALVHKSVRVWMSPVAPQDMRPKAHFYWEANNSLNYRKMWESAIGGGADWVQVITWNDYSEGTEIAPSASTGYSFYDLTAYYVQWFKTGVPPPIRRDVLYYFHRVQPSGAPPDLTRQDSPFAVKGPQPPLDQVELLAFLKEPGVLEIDLAGHAYRETVPAGVQSFRVPLAAGVPTFSLSRRGRPVMKMTSRWPIQSAVVYQDLLYHGGGSAR